MMRVFMLPRLVSVLIGIALVFSLHAIEHRFFPVVQDFEPTSLVYADKHLKLSGYMRKVRSCTYIGVSSEVMMSDQQWVGVPLRFLDNPDDHTASRPPGSQTWGPWTVTLPAPVSEVRYLRLRSTHRCHMAWTTSTDLVVVPLYALLHPKMEAVK